MRWYAVALLGVQLVARPRRVTAANVFPIDFLRGVNVGGAQLHVCAC
jgi:hypothetical protein